MEIQNVSSQHLLADKKTILKNLASLGAPFSLFAENADHSIVSRAWNDKKISAHHAIIPTTVCPNYVELTEMEKNLYNLVARAYIAQFYPPQEFLTTKIDVSVDAEQFTASGKVILQDGWKVLYQKEREESAEADADEAQNLPAVHEGDPVHFVDGNVQEGVTKPPPRFTPATLLKAMKEIHKCVKDKGLKETMKECSGIGTEATRAEVIEIIQKRGYVRLSNFFVPDEIGISLCQILPEQIIFPDITARWENDLDAISRGSMSVKEAGNLCAGTARKC